MSIQYSFLDNFNVVRVYIHIAYVLISVNSTATYINKIKETKFKYIEVVD